MDFYRFKKVKDADTMLLEGQRKKEDIQKNITEEDILKEVSVDIRDKVTPYHHLSYQDQIAKKAEWLTGSEVLSDFSRQLEVQMA